MCYDFDMAKQSENPDVIVKRRKLTEYQADPNNANKGTPRGQKLIRESLKEFGPGRSLVVDKNDKFVAGGQTSKAALAEGYTDVLEVTAPPGVLVIVKREDLDLETDEKARRLALADNRTQQVDLDFSADILLEDPDLLEGFWRDDEIELMRNNLDTETAVIGALEDEVKDSRDRDTDKQRIIRAVLYLGDVATFEQALAATGETNRAEAMTVICKAYLDGIGET